MSYDLQRRRIAVIGGGISGLAAAHRLLELDPTVELSLFEAGPRLGGVLETVQQDGYLIERSADNFITNQPWATDLCRRIGFSEQLLPTSSERRQALVVHDGRLCPVPQGFALMAPSKMWPILMTPILSLAGKLRLLGEFFVPARKDTGDESLASFVRRRLGREVFDRLVQPLVGGIYTADPEKLSMMATMPRFREMEQKHGGLIRAVLRGAGGATKNDSGARYSLFVAPRGGMTSLVEAIAARLPAGTVQLNSPVERLERRGDKWLLQLRSPVSSTDSPPLPSDSQAAGLQEFDGVIVAVPAHHAAHIVHDVDIQLCDELAQIEYAGASVVVLGYRRDQITASLDGFGFVVPACEKRQILSASFASLKFPGRAPEQEILVRVFVGGALQPELADLSDDTLRDLAQRELQELIGVRGDARLVQVVRWPRAMPQYHVNHRELVDGIKRRVDQFKGLELAGNAYDGVGIPHCIHSGETAAERLLGRSGTLELPAQ